MRLRLAMEGRIFPIEASWLRGSSLVPREIIPFSLKIWSHSYSSPTHIRNIAFWSIAIKYQNYWWIIHIYFSQFKIYRRIPTASILKHLIWTLLEMSMLLIQLRNGSVLGIMELDSVNAVIFTDYDVPDFHPNSQELLLLNGMHTVDRPLSCTSNMYLCALLILFI